MDYKNIGEKYKFSNVLVGDTIQDWTWYCLQCDFNIPSYRTLKEYRSMYIGGYNESTACEMKKGDIFGMASFIYFQDMGNDRLFHYREKSANTLDKQGYSCLVTNVMKYNNTPNIVTIGRMFLQKNISIFSDITKEYIRDSKIDHIIKK